MKPQVSVCCAFYNRADYLESTINSLLAQTHDNFEIVVVNDGSTDSRVRPLLDAYDDPRLRVFHQDNAGFVATIRRAIAESQGEFVAIQGAGDLSYPQRLAKQAAAFAADPALGIVSCRQKERYQGGNLDGKTSVSRFVSATPTLETLLGRHTPFFHGEVMFRRSLYDRVGGYRPFFTFAQDRDLWLRMAPHCSMRVLEDVLYERVHFHADGVNANGEKAVQQLALSLFAIQCHFDRERFGYDMLERYGASGYLFRQRHKRLANVAAQRALEGLVRNNMNAARVCSEAAIREAWTASSFMSALVVNMAIAAPPIRGVVTKLNAIRHKLKSSGARA